MDHRTFDHWVAEAARRPSRRAALRLLAAGALSALLTGRAVPGRAAQQSDRDGDGLFDDDEVEVYGTNPDVRDTDGDGVGDGEEIYNRDQGLPGANDPLTAAGGGGAPAPPANVCPEGTADCGFGCQNITLDNHNCGGCGIVCGTFEDCRHGVCQALCIAPGEYCGAEALYPCCAGSGCAPVLTAVGESYYCLTV